MSRAAEPGLGGDPEPGGGTGLGLRPAPPRPWESRGRRRTPVPTSFRGSPRWLRGPVDRARALAPYPPQLIPISGPWVSPGTRPCPALPVGATGQPGDPVPLGLPAGRDARQGRPDDREESPPPLAQRPASRPKSGPPGGPVRSPPSSQQAATCSYGLSAEGSSNGLLNPCTASVVSPCPGPTANQHRAKCNRYFCAEHRDKCPVVHCARGRQERQQTARASRTMRLSQVTLGASVPHSHISSSVRAVRAPAGDLHQGAGPAS